MKLLAIDTSSEACSCALEIDGVVQQHYEVAPRRHTELVLGMVDSLLKAADVELRELDALAVGCGPGSFTGVRIAVGVAQGLAFGAALPVAQVSSLAALAQGALRQFGAQRVLSAFDARMSQVYWGAYVLQAETMSLLHAEGVYDPSCVPVPNGQTGWIGVGEGWAAYANELSRRLGGVVAETYTDVLPQALDVLSLAKPMVVSGQVVPAKELRPVYLRDSVTHSS